MLGPLRAAQVVSLISIFVGLALLTWLYILKRPLPDVVPPSTADAEMRGN
jgi:phosphatidylglycerol:prolipoprotein diacylglycerol transferase